MFNATLLNVCPCFRALFKGRFRKVAGMANGKHRVFYFFRPVGNAYFMNKKTATDKSKKPEKIHVMKKTPKNVLHLLHLHFFKN